MSEKLEDLIKAFDPKLFGGDDASDALRMLMQSAKDTYMGGGDSDSDTVPITIKEIAKIDLKENEILAIGLPEGTDSTTLENISRQLQQYFAKDKEKGINRNILLYVGDWRLHVIAAQEAKEVQEFNKELRSL